MPGSNFPCENKFIAYFLNFWLNRLIYIYILVGIIFAYINLNYIYIGGFYGIKRKKAGVLWR